MNDILDKHVMGLFPRQVGDLIPTLNNEDEGRELLRANGQHIDEMVYPELAKKLPVTLKDKRAPIFKITSSLREVRPFLIDNNSALIYATNNLLYKAIFNQWFERTSYIALASVGPDDYISDLSVSDDGVVIAFIRNAQTRYYLYVSNDGGASFTITNFIYNNYSPYNYSIHVAPSGDCITAVLWSSNAKPSGYEYIHIASPRSAISENMTRKPIFTDHVVAHGVVLSSSSFDAGSPIISDDGQGITLSFAGNPSVLIQTTDGFETSRTVALPEQVSQKNLSFIINQQHQDKIALFNLDTQQAAVTTNGGQLWKEHPELLKTPTDFGRTASPLVKPQLQSSNGGDAFWFDNNYLVIPWRSRAPISENNWDCDYSYQIYLFDENANITSLSEFRSNPNITSGGAKLRVTSSLNQNEFLYTEVKQTMGPGSIQNIGVGGLLSAGKTLPNLNGYKVVSDRFTEVKND